MADNKHKTKAALLNELESIKDLLVGEVDEDDLPTPDDVPLLSEVVDEPLLADREPPKPLESLADSFPPILTSDIDLSVADEASADSSENIDDELEEIRLAYKQVIPDAELPHLPKTPLSEQQITEDTAHESQGFYSQTLAIPGSSKEPEIAESKAAEAEAMRFEAPASSTAGVEPSKPPAEEREETQQSLFASSDLPSAVGDTEEPPIEPSPATEETPEPTVRVRAETDDEPLLPSENPFLPKHIRERQKGLIFGDKQPSSPQEPQFRSDLEALASQVLEEVISDYTPIIEAELHNRLHKLMEAQLLELENDLDVDEPGIDAPDKDPDPFDKPNRP